MLRNLVNFWLSFTRREQLALIILAGMLILVLTFRMLSGWFIAPPKPDLSKAALIILKEIQTKHADTELAMPSKLEENDRMTSGESAGSQLKPFAFDPNTADESTLKALGLRPSQVKNIINYRNKGGKFRSADDFGRLFSIGEDDYRQLAPFITIENTTAETRPAFKEADKTVKQERLPPTVVELNSADSIALLSLPGSGPWTVHRILRYRQALGGFFSPDQLLEVRGIDSLKFEALKPWITIDAQKITPLRINYMDFRELIRHPYLNFDQVKAVVGHRDRKGFLRSQSELLQMQHFSENDVVRLQPYLRFD
ncbi:MAG TPA: helix-hairpin-helix domain-containing protein [Bacteroidales bacterium]|nr:helix-hairpin-helix domain-containing protein [Bacteroidales bacterium]